MIWGTVWFAIKEKENKSLVDCCFDKNNIEPLKFQCPKDPEKIFGTYLSHDVAANNNNNVYIKIRKMEIYEVTLIRRTMLAKSLGLSQLIYTASMLLVPETLIQQTQRKLFAFLWKNKEIRSSDRFCSLPYLRVD